MMELSHETWILAIINMYAFVFGLYITPKFRTISNCIGIAGVPGLIKSSVFFYLIALVGSAVPQIQQLLWFSTYASVVCAIKTKKNYMYAFSFLVFASRMLSGRASKMEALLYCITFLICYDKYFIQTIRQRKKIIIFSAVGAVFMIAAFSFANKERGYYNAQSGLAYYSVNGQVDWNYSASLFMPYMYFSTPWTNLQYVTQTQKSSTNGLWFAKPILGYFGLAENYEREYELVPYSSFNTFTFITVAYKDFGYWLSIIMSLFLGWYVKKVYSRYVISKSPFDITSYILVGLATTEMFFSNHFFMHSYPFTCLIMMEFWKLAIRTNGKNNLELDKNYLK